VNFFGMNVHDYNQRLRLPMWLGQLGWYNTKRMASKVSFHPSWLSQVWRRKC